MTKELAERVQRIKPSPTLAVSARAEALKAAGKNIISLSVGEPDFDTPDFIKDAAIAAIKNGATKYTAVEGTINLRKAIVAKFSRDNHLQYTPDQVLVSCGAKHSLYNLFAAVLNTNDEVIIPAPFWVSYPDMIKLMDATPIIISADDKQHFKIKPEQLAAAITAQTRLVIFNSPSNPTGIAYSKDELMALGKVLIQHPHVLIVTDDIYEHTYWAQEPFQNILTVCPQLYDRTIVVNGVSKAYAMTGWRIGYAAGPKHIIGAMKKIQSQSTSNPCSIAQAAAEAALNGDQSCITTMVHAYKERHDYLVAELNSLPNVRCLPADGTFYSFPNMSGVIDKATTIADDIELAEFLLNVAEIAVVPGSAFGAAGYLRLSYATSMDNLMEAMRRMRDALSKLV